MRASTALCIVVGVLAGAVPNGLPAAEAVENLPVNHWTRLPCKDEPGYVWSPLVYVPARGQVIHWGAAVSGRGERDDVRAFDVAAGDWVSDYPSSPPEALRKVVDTERRDKCVRVWGAWAMLGTGAPGPSFVVNAATCDSKRREVVYTLKGMTAAYDPAARRWRDMGAETELTGRYSLCPTSPYGLYEHGLAPEQDCRGLRIPGSPPVYGAGICYDPASDEIVLLPHWGWQNNDLRPATGRISGHSGTWVYSFKDNLWRRVSGTFGSEDAKKARAGVSSLMGKVSQSLDAAWVLRRRPDAARQAEAAKAMAAAGEEAAAMAGVLPAAARQTFGPAPALVTAAGAALVEGRAEVAIKAGANAIRMLQTVLDEDLRVEPPPRCGAPMVYEPKNKVIVLFGGQSGVVRTDLANPGRAPPPGGLNDTWLYDATSRQWRDVSAQNRPPEQRLPLLVYDEVSGLVLLVTMPDRWAQKGEIVLWAFDAAKGEWTKRHAEPWLHGGTDWASAAMDPKNRLLLLVREGKNGQETFAMHLDLAKLPAEAAPPWPPPPPIVPQEIPPDDPAWLASLKALPANTWMPAKPPREPERRDWGIVACDPVRSVLFYFGGGHSTYQVNDVAVYAVGANRWVHAVGDSNSPIPPHDWDGCTMSPGGGPPAGHQRNSYVALDGRMYVFAGTHSRRWDETIAKEKGTRVAWFYDLDRGGVWRQQEIGEVDLGPNVPGTYGRVHIADPSGKIFGFAGQLEPYDGRFYKDEAYFSCYDVYANRLSVEKIVGPAPGGFDEGRPFCLLGDRGRVFFCECRKGGTARTWVFDLKDRRFVDLKPPHQPPADPRVVEYVDSQKCVLAVVGKGEQWVYSLEKNDWAPVALKVEGGRFGSQTPYTQMVWAAKYGVLVNLCGATYVMRPDFSQVTWD